MCAYSSNANHRGRFAWKSYRDSEGAHTRPTAERIRESLFSILGSNLEGSWVLDLYAGAGTLGLEALSRGAIGAVFVDSSATAIQCIRRNLATLQLESCTVVYKSHVLNWLRRQPLQKTAQTTHFSPQAPTHIGDFDWIFADPPYHRGLAAPTLHALGSMVRAPNTTTLIIEHDRRAPLETHSGSLVRTDQRSYGDTRLSFFSTQPHDDSSSSANSHLPGHF